MGTGSFCHARGARGRRDSARPRLSTSWPRPQRSRAPHPTPGRPRIRWVCAGGHPRGRPSLFPRLVSLGVPAPRLTHCASVKLGRRSHSSACPCALGTGDPPWRSWWGTGRGAKSRRASFATRKLWKSWPKSIYPRDRQDRHPHRRKAPRPRGPCPGRNKRGRKWYAWRRALESASEHPLGRALLKEAAERRSHSGFHH